MKKTNKQTILNKQTKPILVIAHVYYREIFQEIIDCLKNIDVPYDLYVTTVAKNKDLKEQIIGIQENIYFEVLRNKGFDVGPFLHVLNKVHLDNYDYVIKLHTKRNTDLGTRCNNYDMSGNKWRKYAQEFVSTKDKFKLVLDAFKKDSKLGMVSNYHLIMKKEMNDKNAARRGIGLLQKIGIETKNFGFVAGTQFMVRANLLKPLKELNLNLSDFESSNPTHTSSGLAHAMERLFGCLVLNQGFKIKDVINKKHIFDWLLFRKLARFICRKQFCENKLVSIRIFKIPVWRKTI